MRRMIGALLRCCLLPGLPRHLMAQGAPPQGGADQPYTVEYYYKVQWGHQQEFLELFLKNHYPLLQEDCGHRADALGQDRVTGLPHDGRWPLGLSGDDSLQEFDCGHHAPIPTKRHSSRSYGRTRRLIKKKSSDRFEILLAHWDLPVTDITPGKQ